MNDLYLDPLTGDIAIDGLNASIVMGAERVRQNLYVKLKLFTGEWFLDTEFGTPYLDSILGKQITLNGAVAALKTSILEVSDVDSITRFEYTFNRQERNLDVDFDCHTPFGIVNFNNRPIGYSPVGSALEEAGLTIEQFLESDDLFDIIINQIVPSHNY